MYRHGGGQAQKGPPRQSLCLQDASVSQSLKKNLSKKMDGLFVYPRPGPGKPRRADGKGVTSCTTYLSCKSLKERFQGRAEKPFSQAQRMQRYGDFTEHANFTRTFFQKTAKISGFLT